MTRETWLNSHRRTGWGILIGTGVYCAGCGKFHGVTTVAIEEDYMPPEKLPDWPFDENGCPVCLGRTTRVEELTFDELATLSQSALRRALIAAKKRDKR